jgi:hypothetical protein
VRLGSITITRPQKLGSTTWNVEIQMVAGQFLGHNMFLNPQSVLLRAAAEKIRLVSM